MRQKSNERLDDVANVLASQFRNQPTSPYSIPPTLEVLRRSVRHRRIRRRAIRTGGTMVALAMVALTAFMTRKDHGIAPSNELPSLATTDRKELPTVETPLEEFESPIRVLARVMQPEPIFQVDPETQQTWQVGWIETERTVPMDMRQFSPSQKARFQNVLYHNSGSPSL